jgi:hypothetical protein
MLVIITLMLIASPLDRGIVVLLLPNHLRGLVMVAIFAGAVVPAAAAAASCTCTHLQVIDWKFGTQRYGGKQKDMAGIRQISRRLFQYLHHLSGVRRGHGHEHEKKLWWR